MILETGVGGGYQLQSSVTFLALERFKAKFVQSGVTLITYCYKKLINLLTKLLTLYHVWLLFNILYAILNSQKELKKDIKIKKNKDRNSG